MNIRVIYHSRTGNTKKLAEAIADSVNCTAEPAESNSISGQIDLLFIGGAIYGGQIQKSIKKFIDSLDPGKIKLAAVFSTYFLGKTKAVSIIRKLLTDRGITVAEKSIVCRGKYLFFYSRHPDAEELSQAGESAKRIK